MITVAEQSHFKGTQLIFDEAGNTETYDASFLISTLLVFVAKGDGCISNQESEKMIDLLSSRLGTRNAVALERLSSAVMRLAGDTNIAQTLRKIGEGLSAQEKHDVFNMILEVAEVDDDLDSAEIEAIHFSGQILGMSQDAIHSKLREHSLGS